MRTSMLLLAKAQRRREMFQTLGHIFRVKAKERRGIGGAFDPDNAPYGSY